MNRSPSADSRYVAISGVARTWVVDTQTHREVFSRNVDGPDWVALSAETLLIDLPRGIPVPEFLALVAASTGKPARTLVLTHQVPTPGPDDDAIWREQAAAHFDGEIVVGHDLTALDL